MKGSFSGLPRPRFGDGGVWPMDDAALLLLLMHSIRRENGIERFAICTEIVGNKTQTILIIYAGR